ncbi:MAG: CBS domain-containing protein [Patescibacteria group bacterium]
MVEFAKVKDVMTKDVLALNAEDSLEFVAQLFEKYDYDGMPVIGAERKLLGIVTAYDMIVQSSGMHLPTIIGIMGQIAVNQADRKDLDEHFNKLKEIKAKQIMNPKALTIGQNVSIDEAAKLFAEHHRVNPLCVVDDNGILVGVLSRYDIIRFFNATYFQQVVKDATAITDPFKDIAQTKSEREIDSTVNSFSKEFLLVTKKRPRIWKYIAVGMFVAGLVVATALIIRIVQKEALGSRGSLVVQFH